MKKTVLILMIVTLLSKILGFFRDIILSYYYGASFISDVYLVSITIPTVLYAMINTGIVTGFVPVFTKVEIEKGISRAKLFTNHSLNLVLILCTGLFIVGEIFTEGIIFLFASGFGEEAFHLAVQFTRITFVGVYLSGCISVFFSYLQARGIFMAALMGLPANIIIIASIIISKHLDLYMLAYGALLSLVSQFILLLVMSIKQGYRYEFKLGKKNEHLKKMVGLAMPAIIGTSVSQINILIDRTLASQITEGGISALNYANTLNTFIEGIIASSIITVLYPTISRLVAINDLKQTKEVLSMSIIGIAALVLPASAGYVVLSEPIVTFLYGRGQFDNTAILLTSSALFYYSFGLMFSTLNALLTKTFYSLQDSKTPVLLAAISVLANILLNFALSPYLGIGGLALATAISNSLFTCLLFFYLSKRLGKFQARLIKSLIKIIFCVLIMGLISNHFYDLFVYKIGSVLSLLISIFIGAISYIGLVFLVRIPEVKETLTVVKYFNHSKVN